MSCSNTLNASDYTDDDGRYLSDSNCEFGELLNNLIADACLVGTVSVVINIPPGNYFTSTPINWTGRRIICHADGVVINWSGGNKTVITVGADPNNISNQDPYYNVYGDSNNACYFIHISGITFNNISIVEKNIMCIGLRIQNSAMGTYENITLNGFGIGILEWVDYDPARSQSYTDYFNALRTCVFNDCEIGVMTDGDPEYHGMITDDDTTLEFTKYCKATISSGTLTWVSGDALPTSGYVSLVWSKAFRNDCVIDGSYHLTEGAGYALPTTNNTAVRVTWVYGTRTGCTTYVEISPPKSTGRMGSWLSIFSGQTQLDGYNGTLPNSSTPVTLNWTKGVRVWCAIDSSGLLTEGSGTPLPDSAIVAVRWYDTEDSQQKVTTGVVLTNGRLDSSINPSRVKYGAVAGITWTSTFQRTNVYLTTDVIGNVHINGGEGDKTQVGDNWCEARNVEIVWAWGSKTCSLTSHDYYPAVITISGGSGYAMPTDASYVGMNIWQTRIVEATIENGLITLPEVHFLIDSRAVSTDTNFTKANVTATWSVDGQQKTRTGCTFSRVGVYAILGEGTGDDLPDTGDITLSQIRGLVQYRPYNYPTSDVSYKLVYNNGNWTAYQPAYGPQSTCLRAFNIKGTGEIGTLLDLRMAGTSHLFGVDFRPTNSGSKLMLGVFVNALHIERLDGEATVVLSGVRNLITSPLSLENLTIIDESGGV
jgi:hypothetical protein